MTDRELLEAAARAAGIEYDTKRSEPHPKSKAWFGLWLVYHHEPTEHARRYWNPLTDDGDALRLAVKLNFDIYRLDEAVQVTYFVGNDLFQVDERDIDHADPCAATRRAIVRAAATLGESGEKMGGE